MTETEPVASSPDTPAEPDTRHFMDHLEDFPDILEAIRQGRSDPDSRSRRI